MRKNEVSVIIPTWNRASTIRKTVQSCLAQTDRPLEILVCDDGSLDETKNIVESFGKPLIRWVPGPHSGKPAAPRNRGIRQAQGEWLAFLDSDDEWLPEKLEHQLSVLQKTGCLAACSNAYRQIGGQSQGNLLTYSGEQISLDNLLKINLIVCSSVVFHSSLLEEVGGFPQDQELIAVEDYALWLRIATQTNFAYIKEPLLIYQDNPWQSIRAKTHHHDWQLKRTVLKDFLCWLKQTKKTRPALESYTLKTNLSLTMTYLSQLKSRF